MTVAELQAKLATLVAEDPSIADLEVVTDGYDRTMWPTDAKVIEMQAKIGPIRRLEIG